jgi:hypothetical protein
MVISFFKKAQLATNNSWTRLLENDGVLIRRASNGHQLSNNLLPAYLAQLIDDGFATEEVDEKVSIPWTSVYEALRSPGYDELAAVLELPPFTTSQPSLQSRNSLTDQDFSISIAGWRSNQRTAEHPQAQGPMLVWREQVELMRPEQWELFNEVVSFARRQPDQKNEKVHRQAWGKIRSLALKANASPDIS